MKLDPLPPIRQVMLCKTAENCGACHYTRGKGIIGGKERMMSYSGISQMVPKGMILVNFHYPTMSSATPETVSVFKKYHNFIRQDLFERDGDNVKFTRYRCYSDTKTEHSKKTNLNGKDKKPLLWKKFIDSNLPEQTKYYGGYFPIFVLFNYDEWNKALNDEALPLIGVSNYYKTVKNEQGIIGTDGYVSMLGDRNYVLARSPLEFVEKANKGEIELTVHEIKK